MSKVLAVVAGLLFFDVSALKVVPFVYSFNPEDRNQYSFQYYIENKTDDYMAFEISIFRRKVDRNGDDILEKDEHSFRINPKQVIIPPHMQCSIRMCWNGNAEFFTNPGVEQAYRVCMNQFPIPASKESQKVSRRNANIKVTYQIKASLYATPGKAKENLKVMKADSNTIIIKNNGTKRGELRYSNLTLNGRKVVDLIDPNEIHSVVMPNSERIYHIKKTSRKTQKNNHKSEESSILRR